MNYHGWKDLILRLRHNGSSEERRERGRAAFLGVLIRVRMRQNFFSWTRDPQVIHGSSTGFPQAAGNRASTAAEGPDIFWACR
jgi:hypothetical protein